MSTKTGTLLAWHSKNHGLDVLRHALRLLKAKGHPIGQVIYLKRKAEPVAVGPEWDGPPVDIRTLTVSELHTYRGRQGGDIAMLIRRIRAQCARDVVCIGTSATMVSGGLPEQQRQAVAGDGAGETARSA